MSFTTRKAAVRESDESGSLGSSPIFPGEFSLAEREKNWQELTVGEARARQYGPAQARFGTGGGGGRHGDGRKMNRIMCSVLRVPAAVRLSLKFTITWGVELLHLLSAEQFSSRPRRAADGQMKCGSLGEQDTRERDE